MRFIFTCAVAALAAACAATPVHTAAVSTESGRPDAIFLNTSSADAIGLLSSACMDAGLRVVSSNELSVTCEAEMGATQSVLTQVAIGNSYSTPPRQFIRLTTAQISDDVRVQASSWVETQMAFGQIRREPTDRTPQQVSSLTSFLLNAGAQLSDGDSITYTGPRLGFQVVEITEKMLKQLVAVDKRGKQGFYVSSLESGLPAEIAGLEICDQIVKFNGIGVTGMSDLASLDYNPKTIEISRAGTKIEFVLTPVKHSVTVTGGESSESASIEAQIERYFEVCR